MSETIFLFTSSADVLDTIHDLQTWLDAGRVPRPRGEAAWTDAGGDGGVEFLVGVSIRP